MTKRKESKQRQRRSGYEKTIEEKLRKSKLDYKYESESFAYIVQKMYTPDFDLGCFFIETKGNFTPADRRKMLEVKRQVDIDVRLLFQRDNKLNPRSKTRYSVWAEKHGFKWAVGEDIPEEWIREAKKWKRTRRRRNTKTSE